MSDAQEEKAPQDATDPELLNKIHAALIMILRELDAACEQLGISYVVCGGTAIGAARHKGFIPWDDDVDVYMPRGDYERFLAEAPAILPPEFEVLSSRSHPDYPKTFGILGLVGSTFTPQVARNRKFPIPIGIDLFPLDPIPEDPSAFSRQARSTWLWGRLLFLHGTPTPEVDLPFPVKQLAGAIMHLIHWGLRAARVKPITLEKRWERAARRYEGSGSTRLGDFSTRDPARWSASLDELFPAQRVPFEDITVMTARDFDAVLTRHYGDYMQPPPEDQRANHQASTVVLGPNAPDSE